MKTEFTSNLQTKCHSIFMKAKQLLFILLIFFVETSMLRAESQGLIRGT
jgi:hypothetical protein